MIEVRELLIKAFASAWRVRESALQTTDREQLYPEQHHRD